MEFEVLSSGPFRFSGGYRSPGIHQSEITHRLCIEQGVFTEQDNPDYLLWDLGLAHERAIIDMLHEQFPDCYIRLGELEKDGIIVTCDCARFTTTICPREIKLTRSSAVYGPGSRLFRRYEMQLKCQCYVLDTLHGELDVTHIDGDLSYPKKTVRQEIGYTFTRWEIIENWMMYRTMAAKIKEERAHSNGEQE